MTYVKLFFLKGEGQTGPAKGTGAEAGTSGGMEAPSEDYEVVYVKDNVSVHPTQNANGRISGRLRLIKQGPSLFMVHNSSSPLRTPLLTRLGFAVKLSFTSHREPLSQAPLLSSECDCFVSILLHENRRKRCCFWNYLPETVLVLWSLGLHSVRRFSIALT